MRATNSPSAPFPVKKAVSSLSPPVGLVPGTGWRMDDPSRKNALAVCGSTFGWLSMLGLRWIGGRLDVQPRAHPGSETTDASARKPSSADKWGRDEFGHA